MFTLFSFPLDSVTVVPKSYRLEVRPRSISDEFPSQVIIRNCRLLQYGELFQ